MTDGAKAQPQFINMVLTDGNVVFYPISDVVSFSSNNEELHFNFVDGTTAMWYASAIRKMTFDDLITEVAPNVHVAEHFKVFPNPSSGMFTFEFTTEGTSRVVTEIWDMKGSLLWQREERVLFAGTHQVMWNGVDRTNRNVPSGTYLCRITVDGRTSAQKVIVQR